MLAAIISRRPIELSKLNRSCRKKTAENNKTYNADTDRRRIHNAAEVEKLHFIQRLIPENLFYADNFRMQ